MRDTNDPREGLAGLRAPIDYVLMAAFGIGNFFLSLAGYWFPQDRIFDEVYFARAAMEYLENQRIYENTHPPLSKLLVTLSVMLFGGVSHGDTSYGWRFLDVVFAAFAVVALYALAKRVTSSTAFASMAALLFTFDGMHFVQSRIATPESFAVFFSTFGTYALLRSLRAGRSIDYRWLVVFAVALGCLVSTKWYGVMVFGVAAVVLTYAVAERRRALPRALATVALVSLGVYALSWVPDLVRQSPDPNEIHNVSDVLARQYSMFEYHATLRATHPYASRWWEWPFDYVPVAYYYQDLRADRNDPHACCIEEVTSMPSPVILWFGVFAVPFAGVLAWRERNAGYAVIVLTYLLQWMPWSLSPRLAWEYHFYVNVPLICACEAVVFARFWQWGRAHADRGNAWMAAIATGGFVLAAGCAFVFFYPVLSATPITWDAWHARMWLPTWVIGPG